MKKLYYSCYLNTIYNCPVIVIKTKDGKLFDGDVWDFFDYLAKLFIDYNFLWISGHEPSKFVVDHYDRTAMSLDEVRNILNASGMCEELPYTGDTDEVLINCDWGYADDNDAYTEDEDTVIIWAGEVGIDGGTADMTDSVTFDFEHRVSDYEIDFFDESVAAIRKKGGGDVTKAEWESLVKNKLSNWF